MLSDIVLSVTLTIVILLSVTMLHVTLPRVVAPA